MECPFNNEAAQIVIDYCAGALGPPLRDDFERHLDACAECSRVVRAQREVWESLDRMATPAVSADFDSKLYARIARESAAPAWLRWMRRVFQPPVPVAAWKPALSVVAAGAVLAAGLLVRPPHRVVATPQMQSQHIDIEQVQTALDDIDVLMPPVSAGAM